MSGGRPESPDAAACRARVTVRDLGARRRLAGPGRSDGSSVSPLLAEVHQPRIEDAARVELRPQPAREPRDRRGLGVSAPKRARVAARPGPAWRGPACPPSARAGRCPRPPRTRPARRPSRRSVLRRAALRDHSGASDGLTETRQTSLAGLGQRPARRGSRARAPPRPRDRVRPERRRTRPADRSAARRGRRRRSANPSIRISVPAAPRSCAAPDTSKGEASAADSAGRPPRHRPARHDQRRRMRPAPAAP